MKRRDQNRSLSNTNATFFCLYIVYDHAQHINANYKKSQQEYGNFKPLIHYKNFFSVGSLIDSIESFL